MSKHPPVQIVDENDEPIGSAPIEEVYQKGLYHRIVRVMVEDHKGSIVLQKRASNMTTFPNCWDNSAAGHVDAGESYRQAAERELFEEIGVTGDLQEIGAYPTNTKKGIRLINRFNKVYKTTITRSLKFSLQTEEVSQVRWYTAKEAKRLIEESPDRVTDGLIDIMNRYY